MIIKAISVNIYESKAIGNCSNDGLSTRFDDVLLEHPQGWIEVDTENPPENFCKLSYIRVGADTHEYIRPVKDPEHLGWMYGGCVCYSSDARFHEISDYPLCLHDRQETQELYDLLSR